ncbi:MAG: RNA methyltransferase [Alphaproteobacteria bacterium]|nr:RNA methyltransferase [Alphaproteobacteria bacterium]
MTPAIILINPQMGENIGAVARAMMNFGLRELRIVAPRDGWPNTAAEAMAAHGVEIIHNAKLYDTTRDAVADLQYIYASTARDRRLRKPQITPREAMEEACQRHHAQQKTGIMFGPERSGLNNDDIALAHAIVTVPTDPDHASLNLAQCAVILGYEWFSAQSEKTLVPNAELDADLASQEEIHGFLDQLETALDATYYFKLDAKKQRMWRNLKTTFLRTELNSQEIHSLRGMVSALEKGRKKPENSP